MTTEPEGGFEASVPKLYQIPVLTKMTTELTDTELRVKCAEAMEWKRYRAINKDLDEWLAPKGQRFYGWRIPDVIPNYPSDPAAALTLVDKLTQDDWRVEMRCYSNNWWDVILRKQDNPGISTTGTFCRAICRAFLAVKGKDV